MNLILIISTIVIGILIIILTLVQGKGEGLGSAWGGMGGNFQTRRGLEKWMLKATILLVIIFFVISVIGILQ